MADASEAMRVKAITLWPEWAALAAQNIKRIETRSWPAPKALIGERLLIHAAAKSPTAQTLGNWEVWRESDVAWWLDGRKRDPESDAYFPIARKAIVASCVLADCVPMVLADCVPLVCSSETNRAAALTLDYLFFKGLAGYALNLSLRTRTSPRRDVTDQFPFGDFAPGRHAWLLEDIKPVEERCPVCWGGECAAEMCGVCEGKNVCGPIPAEGHQRIWNWEPA